jgi:hypothetical protein
MENLNSVPGVGAQVPKKSKRQMILGAIVASLLVVAIVFGATTNFFGAVKKVATNAVSVGLASSPVSDTVAGGDTNVPLVGFTFTAGSIGPVTLNSLALTGFIDDEGAGSSYEKGTSTDYSGSLPVGSVITSIWAQDGLGTVLGSAGTFDSTGKVTLSGLSLLIAKSSTQTVTIYGNISSSAGYNSVADRVAVDILANKDVGATTAVGSIAAATLNTHNMTGSTPAVYVEIPVVVATATIFSIDDVCSDYEVYSADNTFCFDNNCTYDSEGNTYCVSEYCDDTTPYINGDYLYCDTDTCYYDLENPGEYDTSGYASGCKYADYEFWSGYCTKYSFVADDEIYCLNDDVTYYADGTSTTNPDWFPADGCSDYYVSSAIGGLHYFCQNDGCSYYPDGTSSCLSVEWISDYCTDYVLYAEWLDYGYCNSDGCTYYSNGTNSCTPTPSSGSGSSGSGS